MILSKSQEGTESYSLISFVEKLLFKIKESQKAPQPAIGVNQKENVYALINNKNHNKKHLYMLDQVQSKKLLATANQLIRKIYFCCLNLKNQAFFHRANVQIVHQTDSTNTLRAEIFAEQIFVELIFDFCPCLNRKIKFHNLLNRENLLHRIRIFFSQSIKFGKRKIKSRYFSTEAAHTIKSFFHLIT